jgi:hypothetical protein
MGATTQNDWLSMCRDRRIDPDEVRLVFGRYEAYRDFNQARVDSGISLDQWFRFYHMEKSTDGENAGPAASGCSVDSDAVNNACIRRPGPFLEVLKAYRTVADIG